MAGGAGAEGSTGGLRTSRLDGLSDAVFAVALTILVLELGVPAGSEDHLLRAILEEWPSYLAYVVSFSTIGATWLAHSVITQRLHHADVTFVRLNLLLLLVVSFLPYPTRLLTEYFGNDDAQRVAATFYGLTLLATSTLVWLMWRLAVRRGLVRPEVAEEESGMLDRRLAPSLVSYVVLLGLGLLVPVVAIVGYLLIAAFLILPFRHRGKA